MVGEGDEPHGHGEKSHRAHERKLEAFAFFKQKGDAREEGDEQRGDKGRLGEVDEGRRRWITGQRRKKRLTSEKSDTGNRLSSKSATNIEMTMESKSTRGRGVGSGAEHLALVELSASPG